MNHYCLSISSQYFEPSFETMYSISILDCNYKFLIISINLSPELKEKLKLNFNCDIIEPEETFYQFFEEQKWPKEIFYKYILAWRLPTTIDRIICLGADMIVKKDLSFLFDVDLSEYAIAGAIENDGNLTSRFKLFLNLPYDRIYINCEFLVLNLDYLRKYYTEDYILSKYVEIKSELIFFDQDYINFIFYGKIKILSPIFNYQIYNYNRNVLIEGIQNAYILHFSALKPWENYKSEPWIIKIYYNSIYYSNLKVKVRHTYIKACLYNILRQFKYFLLSCFRWGT